MRRILDLTGIRPAAGVGLLELTMLDRGIQLLIRGELGVFIAFGTVVSGGTTIVTRKKMIACVFDFFRFLCVGERRVLFEQLESRGGTMW